MRDQLLALYKLQEIDTRVLQVEQSAAELPVRIRALEGELEGKRTELGALHSEAEQKRTEQRDAESLIADETAKIQKWKRRLNDIKTPREYQALSREVEQGERLVHEQEDRVLALSEEIQGKQAVIQEKEAELKANEARVNGEIRELKDKQSKLSREAAEIKRGREAITKTLPAPLLKQYDRIRERRGGSAIALTKGSSCSGCNVEIRPQQMVEVRKLNSLQTCAKCNRILILESLVLSGKEASA